MLQYDKSHLHLRITTPEKSVIDIVNDAQHAIESLREILKNENS
jgi:hypothetical protein